MKFLSYLVLSWVLWNSWASHFLFAFYTYKARAERAAISNYSSGPRNPLLCSISRKYEQWYFFKLWIHSFLTQFLSFTLFFIMIVQYLFFTFNARKCLYFISVSSCVSDFIEHFAQQLYMSFIHIDHLHKAIHYCRHLYYIIKCYDAV